MDKKHFWTALRSVAIEMVVMALIFGGIGLGAGCLLDAKRVVCMGVGGFVGITVALLSIWKRMKVYLRD